MHAMYVSACDAGDQEIEGRRYHELCCGVGNRSSAHYSDAGGCAWLEAHDKVRKPTR